MCTSFGKSSDDLCHSLARSLCTVEFDKESLVPLLACRLIAIDKRPGVRPIGIEEVVQRVVAKVAIAVLKPDILDVTGCKQLCIAQIGGVEAGVHSIRKLHEMSDATLMVEASNAFNALNRSVALYNVKSICPSFYTILHNCYGGPTHLFLGGKSIIAHEGVTQGDPLAMPFYAIATVPLIDRLPGHVSQVWYADDAAAVGNLNEIKRTRFALKVQPMDIILMRQRLG